MAGNLTEICMGEYNKTHNISDPEANEYMGVGDVKKLWKRKG